MIQNTKVIDSLNYTKNIISVLYICLITILACTTLGCNTVPSEDEIIKNPASRSAKLRQATRTEQSFYYPDEFKEKFKRYIDIENVTIK